MAVAEDSAHRDVPERRLRAGIYGRASDDHQKTGRSVTSQLQVNREAVDHQSWDLAGVYKDNDRSASRFAKKAREDWPRLVDDLLNDRLDVLVIFEVSRGSRDLVVWATLLQACRERGTLIHLTSHGRTYDPRQSRDWRILAEDAVDAAHEADKISDRVQRGIRTSAAAGRPHGKIAYGWTRIYDAKTGALLRQTLHPEQAAVVREVADRIASGETCYGIAGDLNRRGALSPTGKQWDQTSIRRLILRPSNIGRRVHRGVDVGEATWEPILLTGTYYTCLRILNDPARSAAHDHAVRHFLTGLCLCGVCGAAMRRITGRWPVYSCLGEKSKKAAPEGQRFCTSITQRKLDTYIERLSVARLRRPDLREQLIESSEDAAIAVGRVAELKARLEAIYDEYAAGGVTAAGVARIESQLLPEIERAEARCSLATASPLVARIAGPDAAAKWSELNILQRREVVRTLMRIRIMPVGHGRLLPELGEAGEDVDPATAARYEERVRVEWLT